MKPVTFEGYTYKSISAAWRALSPPGLPMITVRWRLNDGWRKGPAFLTPAVPAVERRGYKEKRS